MQQWAIQQFSLTSQNLACKAPSMHLPPTSEEWNPGFRWWVKGMWGERKEIKRKTPLLVLSSRLSVVIYCKIANLTLQKEGFRDTQIKEINTFS